MHDPDLSRIPARKLRRYVLILSQCLTSLLAAEASLSREMSRDALLHMQASAERAAKAMTAIKRRGGPRHD